MRIKCQSCGNETSMRLPRGARIADARCHCGGSFKRAQHIANPNVGKKMGKCPVCGKRRLEGRSCFWHPSWEVSEARRKQAAAAEEAKP